MNNIEKVQQQLIMQLNGYSITDILKWGGEDLCKPENSEIIKLMAIYSKEELKQLETIYCGNHTNRDPMRFKITRDLFQIEEELRESGAAESDDDFSIISSMSNTTSVSEIDTPNEILEKQAKLVSEMGSLTTIITDATEKIVETVKNMKPLEENTQTSGQNAYMTSSAYPITTTTYARVGQIGEPVRVQYVLYKFVNNVLVQTFDLPFITTP